MTATCAACNQPAHPRFIDTLDRGCRSCGATYTAGETHVCDGEELLLGCAACPYELEAHVDGQCPTEVEAVAAWGRS